MPALGRIAVAHAAEAQARNLETRGAEIDVFHLRSLLRKRHAAIDADGLADDLAGVDFVAGADKESTALLQMLECVGAGVAGFVILSFR